MTARLKRNEIAVMVRVSKHEVSIQPCFRQLSRVDGVVCKFLEWSKFLMNIIKSFLRLFFHEKNKGRGFYFVKYLKCNGNLLLSAN